MDNATAQHVSDALRRSSYTVDGVIDILGASAVAALTRNEPAPARAALGDSRDPLATLVRLLLVGDGVGVDDVKQVLPVERMSSLLSFVGDEVTCDVEVAPHAEDGADWWVVSDRTDARGRPRRPDHVLGVGGASTTLAQLTVRRPVETALDIGTGCGVQALHLTRHARHVTATDAVPRAVTLAATGFALSGVEVELAEGDLAEPVRERRFDVVVCNPPFVVGPSSRFHYRDAGRDGDDISCAAVRAAASVLAEGGVAHLLANWLHVEGEDWRDRVAGWVADLGCDAWLVERDLQDPVDYVSTWLADAGEDDQQLAEAWLRWFTAHRVDAVGFGWVTLRRVDTGSPRIAVETATQAVDQPLGPQIAGWLDAVAWLRDRPDEALLAAHLTVAPGVRLDVASGPGASGWQPLAQALRLDGGWNWTLPCDDATAAIVSACDGSTPLKAIVAVLAVTLGVAEAELAPAVCATVRGLVDRGLLHP